eukprot:TRINITY_DN80896_c0_g1_i1.p1 TRINITY_DN80896_c0_g1~~TRINITY_DN80896_c0_g1_i1.p1  ORF type:complete len:653 (+),score=111.51 TRINITY_DN80896_c0_g1_i1:176-1960(+)
MEIAFCADQAPKLYNATKRLARIIFLLLLLNFFSELQSYWLVGSLMVADIIQMVSTLMGVLFMLALAAVKNLGELTAMLVLPALITLALLTHRYRVPFFTGEGMETVLQRVDSSSVMTDSIIMINISTAVQAFYVGLPVRCKYGVAQVAVVPAIYLAFTLPLPSGTVEGGTRRRMLLAIRIVLASMIGFAGRSYMELQARLDFLSNSQLIADLRRERVMRASVEYEAQQGHTRLQAEDGLSELHSCRDSELQSTNLSSVIFGRSDHPNNSFPSLQRKAMIALGLEEGWIISAAQLECFPDDIIGEGGFGQVMMGKYMDMDVAVKVRQEAKLEPNTLGSELRVLRMLRHPRIVSFFGACILEEEGEIFLVMELVRGKPLISDIANLHEKPITVLHRVLLDICEGLAYLHGHKPPIVHGDLKPHNIILEAPAGRACLIDFGLAEVWTHAKSIPGGTLRWMSPEALLQLHGKLSCGSDIFSFGRLCFFVITAQKPLESADREWLTSVAKQGKVPHLEWPAPTSDGEHELQDQYEKLCESCMHFDSHARIRSTELLRSLTEMSPDVNAAATPRSEEDSKASLLDALIQVRNKVRCQQL